MPQGGMIGSRRMRIAVPKWLFWSVIALSTIGIMGGVVYVSERKPTQPEPSPAGFEELSLLAKKGKSDKGFPGHWYTENYERFLRAWKDRPIRICEIGIAGGGSLVMWQGYFPNASIYGIDIADSTRFENDRVKTCIADQSKREQLKSCMDRFGGLFDLIIDDGGHSMEQQQVSFGFLFPYLRPGGLYSIEDLHTSMPGIYPGFGADADEANTTLTMIFKYVHTAPPIFESKYMLPEELAQLNAQVETADLHLANNQGHSMMCIFKKRAPNPLLDAPAAPASPSPAPAAPAGDAKSD
jgi:hypothetical protein